MAKIDTYPPVSDLESDDVVLLTVDLAGTPLQKLASVATLLHVGTEKIADGLTGQASPGDSDLVLLVRDPAGTPALEKVTFANLLESRATPHGQIYTSGGVGSQALVADTITKIVQFENAGPSFGTTPLKNSDKITIVRTGVYRIEYSVSFEGDANVEHQFIPHFNGIVVSEATSAQTPSAAGDPVNVAGSGFVNASVASQDLDIRVKAISAGSTFVVRAAQLLCVRVGPAI